jgi:hypothetical protein
MYLSSVVVYFLSYFVATVVSAESLSSLYSNDRSGSMTINFSESLITKTKIQMLVPKQKQKTEVPSV